MLDLSKSGFKTSKELRELAPSIFTTKPSSEVTDKYKHIPTNLIIRDMELLGWFVVDAKEVKARTEGTKGFQKHLVVFRNPDVVINDLPEGVRNSSSSPTGYRNSKGQFIKDNGYDQIFPQILLTNSHDARNAFHFTAGLFRMVCENGIVISTEEFADIKIVHMGYEFEVLQEQIRNLVENLPLTIDSMNKMRETELEEEQILEFAQRALECRFTDNELLNINVDVEDLVFPKRTADKGNDLWKVFNVVQERIINGNFEYSNGVKVRKARKIKNFKQNMKVNVDLFNLALEYVA